MKKMGKLFALFLSSLFVSLAIFSLVSAADTNLPSPGQVANSAGTGIANWFNSSSGFLASLLGYNNVGFAKILIFFLIALVIYAIADLLPFMNANTWIRWGISIVIALLSSLYLNVQDVYTVLLSYTALGITITGIIPFVIISIIAKKEYDAGRTFTSRLLWLAFTVILLIKAIGSWQNLGNSGEWIYLILIVASVLMFLWDHRIYFFMFRQQIKAGKDIAGAEALASITARLEEIREEIDHAPSDAAAKPLIERWNRLVKRQNELGGNYRPWGSP